MLIKISDIVIKDHFNVRNELGDLSELIDSIKQTKGILEPILVCKLANDKYELLAGERRLAASKEANFKEIECRVIEANDEFSKFELMFHENIGRKDLTWVERAKATKLYYEIAKKHNKETEKIFQEVTEKQDQSKTNITRYLKLARCIEEFPQLEKQSTSKAVNNCYIKLKKLDLRTQEKVRNNELSLKQAIIIEKQEKVKLDSNSDKLVIDEYKKELEYYKSLDFLNDLDKEERIQKGVWLIDEVEKLVKAARSCEAFGLKDMDKQSCIECEKDYPSVKAMCDWWFEMKKAT